MTLLTKYSQSSQPYFLILFIFFLISGCVRAASPTGIGIIGEHDHRTPVEPDQWPWVAVGRLNRYGGGFCTATLVTPQQVLTAAHCLYHSQNKRWYFPEEIHFVAGFRRDSYRDHAVADYWQFPKNYLAIKQTDPKALMTYDWALITLDHPLKIQPIPMKHETSKVLTANVSQGILLRVGYSKDRPYLPMVHRGCQIAQSFSDRLWFHTCDSSFGDSGSPILWQKQGTFFVVGVHTSVLQRKDGRFGVAVPTTAMAFSTSSQQKPNLELPGKSR